MMLGTARELEQAQPARAQPVQLVRPWSALFRI
jgi:hypothetical protein